jgi:hypothetical protein
MGTILAIAFVVVLVLAFLRFVPRGADPIRLRRFNRQALGLLATICVVAIAALCWRARSVELAVSASSVFALAFVPFYLLCAGVLRFRSLCPSSSWGRLTL